MNHRINRSEWLALLLLSVLWGDSFFFAAVLIKTLPFTIIFPARWIARRDPERVCKAILRQAGLWIASRSPSPRVHSRDPLARNDDLKYVA